MNGSGNAHVRAIVLAAGKGTRMKSARPKVMHRLAGREMLWYVLRALHEAGITDIVVVTSAELDPHVRAVAMGAGHRFAGIPGEGGVRTIVQEPQLGTGHAVQIALGALADRTGRVLVLNGDMPLIDAALVARVLADDAALALVTATMPLPSAFGRIVRSDGNGGAGDVARIIEQRDATPDELAIDEMNAGLYAFDETKLRAAAAELRNDNAQGEYYLTDTVAALVARGERVVPVRADDHRTVLGVNDRVELAAAAQRINARLCEHHMRAGVTIVDPASTWLEPELTIAPDVTVLPNTTIGRRSSIGAHSEIGPNARLQNARIGEHAIVTDSIVVDSAVGDYAIVGPWSHIRAGSELGTGARIGNFVEVKKSKIGPGVKAGHLSYLGDATVGARANIGAGTITCNYDGTNKNATAIGEDAFIGSNTSLVAPVTIGDRAATGASAVVIRDVPSDDRVVGNPARSIGAKRPATP